ncbi:hypothetical protein RND71_005654 [Anisodus tanguticus]|uniref:Uncharacterized protein n=1 Tax=Anisodus tanguticus TaxID=243964 RepID=A0AAE1VMW4_9SOLA|nr:hypothetical protein RND71_005654 [Anisodus tanguticus]
MRGGGKDEWKARTLLIGYFDPLFTSSSPRDLSQHRQRSIDSSPPGRLVNKLPLAYLTPFLQLGQPHGRERSRRIDEEPLPASHAEMRQASAFLEYRLSTMFKPQRELRRGLSVCSKTLGTSHYIQSDASGVCSYRIVQNLINMSEG